MKPISVLVADDHTLVRAGIRSLLESFGGVEVVAEASDGREAIALLRTHTPDLILMDIAMRGLNGLEAAARIRKSHPKIRIIMLSMHASEEYVMQALRSGAAGYLLKDSATLELELALKAVMNGETYLSPPISKQVVESYMNRVGDEQGTAVQLTPRQREILQLIVEGFSTKDIAARLHLSTKTVETHRTKLMERLDIHDIPGLVRYAIRVGISTADK
ncbi:response regulator transcription factor [Azoarcus sp. DN11]|uniref:response regulator n=1 Tax=Azoarcus sp. DN11 TaxID=356837 RepID=UPI000EAB6A1B|nr:response regulator transcription factor [Azoarcus sp. DN11]AYH43259.1 DNA-binding response regulator [Azoarcus sp. DN11]